MDSGKQISSAGVTLIEPGGAPSSYHMVSKIKNLESGTSQMTPLAMSASSERKKRGRPRKYKPEESGSGVFPAMPMSSSAPPGTGKSYCGEGKPSVSRTSNSEKRQKNKIGAENLDDSIECSTGSSFIPHVLTVNTGEDISTKIMEFSQQGPRAVCVISGSGMVSNATIRHPNSSGGTLTYEGLFEIISFSGSFTLVEMLDSQFSRSGMMTITLTGADGRVVGGLIAGLTIAASPVKVVVASFLLGNSHESRAKIKHKIGHDFPVDAQDNVEERKTFPNNVHESIHATTSLNDPNNWAAAMQLDDRSRKSTTTDINISLQ